MGPALPCLATGMGHSSRTSQPFQGLFSSSTHPPPLPRSAQLFCLPGCLHTNHTQPLQSVKSVGSNPACCSGPCVNQLPFPASVPSYTNGGPALWKPSLEGAKQGHTNEETPFLKKRLFLVFPKKCCPIILGKCTNRLDLLPLILVLVLVLF